MQIRFMMSCANNINVRDKEMNMNKKIYITLIAVCLLLSVSYASAYAQSISGNAEFFSESAPQTMLNSLKPGNIIGRYTVQGGGANDGQTMFFALYQGQTLIDFTSGQREGSVYLGSITVPDEYEDCFIATFLWNENMSPLADKGVFPKIYQEDFQGRPLGDLSADSKTQVNAAGGSVVIESDGEGGKMLSLHDTSQQYPTNVVMMFPEMQAPVEITAKVKFNRGEYVQNVHDISYDWIRLGYWTGSAFRIVGAVGALDGQGGRWVHKNPDAETAITGGDNLSLDTWYELKMVYTKEHRIIYFIDGKRIREERPFIENNIVNAVNFYTSNIRMSSMSISHFEVKPYISFEETFEGFSDVPSFEHENWTFQDAIPDVLSADEMNQYIALGSNGSATAAFEGVSLPAEVNFRAKIIPDMENVLLTVGFGREGQTYGQVVAQRENNSVSWNYCNAVLIDNNNFPLENWTDMSVYLSRDGTASVFANGIKITEKNHTQPFSCIDFMSFEIENGTVYIDDVSVRPLENPVLSRMLDWTRKDMIRLYNSIMLWTAGQYDPQSGGFYFAKSSKDNPHLFGPDIESTSQAVSLINTAGFMPYMPQDVKNGLITYFKTRQDPTSGYFLDPQNVETTNDRQRARNLSFSVNSLNTLGSQPDYPLPSERLGEVEVFEMSIMSTGFTLPDYLNSVEDYEAWIEELPWSSSPWTAGDRLSSSGTYLGMLSEAQALPFWQVAWDWLNVNQNPQTGMWGSGNFGVRASGVFKVVSYLRLMPVNVKGEVWFPNAQNYYQEVLENVAVYLPSDIFFPRNILDSIYYLRDLLEITPQERDLLLTAIYGNINLFRIEDGGVSQKIGYTVTNTAGGYNLGLGLEESDINSATAGFLPVYNRFYNMTGLISEPLSRGLAEVFYQKLTAEIEQ